MGTFCAIAAIGPSDRVDRAIELAFAEIGDVERLMHPTSLESDLRRLNESRAQSIRIDARTWEVLHLAQHIHDLSDGCFDPCLPKREGRMNDLQLQPGGMAMCGRPMFIDLGGIAKGFAVDRAVAALLAAGCSSGIVNAGGDVRVFGDDEHPIQIRLSDRRELPIVLQDRALAVSDADSTHHPQEFRGYYSRDAHATFPYRQAAIIARTAAIADALTKCAILCKADALQFVMTTLGATIVYQAE